MGVPATLGVDGALLYMRRQACERGPKVLREDVAVNGSHRLKDPCWSQKGGAPLN